MFYSVLADVVVLLHFGFILFATFGALLIVRWPRLIWLHLPAVVWALTIEVYGGVCPLTPLENWLNQIGGDDGYNESFIQHYLVAVIYPDHMTKTTAYLLATVLVFINIAIYSWLIKRRVK